MDAENDLRGRANPSQTWRIVTLTMRENMGTSQPKPIHSQVRIEALDKDHSSIHYVHKTMCQRPGTRNVSFWSFFSCAEVKDRI